MTKRQMEVLQHALGLDQYGQGTMYRNQYCAGGDDVATCRELITLGYMQQHPTTDVLPYFNCSVTHEGKKAALAESPAPPKRTRSQQRYDKFLEADSGMRFREWLRYQNAREAQ